MEFQLQLGGTGHGSPWQSAGLGSAEVWGQALVGGIKADKGSLPAGYNSAAHQAEHHLAQTYGSAALCTT